MSVSFIHGEFQKFRAATKFHLGPIEEDVNEGDVLEFDGSTVKIGGKEHLLPALKGAIKGKWLVPIDASYEPYHPVSANIQVHPAQSMKADRGQSLHTQVVYDEDRDLGSIKKVRDHGEGIVRKSKALITEEGGDGRVVGKLRTATSHNTTIDARNVMRLAQEINRIDNINGASTVSQRVMPAKASFTVEDLVEDAVVARIPPVREGNLGEGDDPHLTPVEKEAKREAVAEARAIRRSQSRTSSQPVKESLPEVTWEALIKAIPQTMADVLDTQGISDVDTLRDVLRDPLAGAELARELKAGPTIKLRKALGLA